MPTNYQGNPEKKPKEEVPEKVVEKIVTTEVIVKKKSIGRRFKDVFFGGDFKSAARYVVADVLLPALRNMVADSGKAAIDRAIYGETRSSRRDPRYTSYVQYNNPFRAHPLSTNLPDQPRHYPPSAYRQNRPDSNQLVIVNRREAEMIVERLIDIIDKYDFASVADLNDLVGLPVSHIDNKWGWTTLNSVEIRQIRDGYLIDLPNPEPI